MRTYVLKRTNLSQLEILMSLRILCYLQNLKFAIIKSRRQRTWANSSHFFFILGKLQPICQKRYNVVREYENFGWTFVRATSCEFKRQDQSVDGVVKVGVPDVRAYFYWNPYVYRGKRRMSIWRWKIRLSSSGIY